MSSRHHCPHKTARVSDACAAIAQPAPALEDEAAWLPLGDYYESTKATSARQGVDENFNAFVVRHVLEACERGDDLSALGFAGRKMPSPKGYVKGVTGLTSKPEFWMFSQWRDSD